MISFLCVWTGDLCHELHLHKSFEISIMLILDMLFESFMTCCFPLVFTICYFLFHHWLWKVFEIILGHKAFFCLFFWGFWFWFDCFHDCRFFVYVFFCSGGSGIWVFVDGWGIFHVGLVGNYRGKILSVIIYVCVVTWGFEWSSSYMSYFALFSFFPLKRLPTIAICSSLLPVY